MPQTPTTRALLSCLACLAMACTRGPNAQTTRLTSASPETPWDYYDRAVTMHRRGQTDAAVDAYREAEAHFSEADRWGKSISIYGRARALADAGRCGEARATYADFASFVRDTAPQAADMALRYGKECQEARTISDQRAADVAVAVVARDYTRALQLADSGVAGHPREADPWLDYNRAVALVETGRFDDAVTAFTIAEREFGGANENRWGRAISIYGRARALEAGLRCTEAKRAYEEFASLVRNDDPSSATTALDVARRCKRPVTAR
jgi:tetratricopeptide (TPR) repeat protein